MNYEVNLTVEPAPRNSRLFALLGIFQIKWLLLLPHLILLTLITLIWGFVVWIGYWIVLFSGRMPDGLRSFITGYQRWLVRVVLWNAGIVDRYPPFTFSNEDY